MVTGGPAGVPDAPAPAGACDGLLALRQPSALKPASPAPSAPALSSARREKVPKESERRLDLLGIIILPPDLYPTF